MDADQGWRVFPHTYARKCSNKSWQPYNYLTHASRIIAQKISEGNGRIIIDMPPRHGKSEFISKWLPAWYLDTFPSRNIILTSYGDELAGSFGRWVRNFLNESPHARVKLKSDSTSAQRFDTTFGGSMITAGIGGGITGRGGHLLICDDPYKNWEEASSENFRKKVKDWFDTTFKTRQEPNCTIILLMTRWHHDDLAGQLIADTQEKWDVISFPAIAEENDILGRSVGQPLCPDRYDVDSLLAIKAGLPDQYWNSLYQQRPSSLAGDIFKTEWWKSYDSPPQHFTNKVQFWDTAQKPGITNDYSVCATWGFSYNGAYLLDVWRKKVEAPELEDAVKQQFNLWRPNQVQIEDKSSGISIIQYLQRFTSLPVIPYMPRSDKVLRAIASTPFIRAGRCFLPKQAHWLSDFVKEHNEFPNGAHDDQVDTTSQMVEYFNNNSSYEPRVRSL